MSQGNSAAHLLRRFIHLSTLLIALVYYFYGNSITQAIGFTPSLFLLLLLVIILVLEILRLKFKWVIFGQREYEIHQISGLTWGMLGIVAVLLIAPGPQFGIPLIASYAVGDPLLGELRKWKWKKSSVLICSTVAIMAIWGLCAIWLSTPWILALLISPFMVATEWFKCRWIDDNFMMLFFPLLLMLLIIPFC